MDRCPPSSKRPPMRLDCKHQPQDVGIYRCSFQDQAIRIFGVPKYLDAEDLHDLSPVLLYALCERDQARSYNGQYTSVRYIGSSSAPTARGFRSGRHHKIEPGDVAFAWNIRSVLKAVKRECPSYRALSTRQRNDLARVGEEVLLLMFQSRYGELPERNDIHATRLAPREQFLYELVRSATSEGTR